MSVANITVTISTLDRPEALARCLDALFSGHKLPAELVVVDQSNNHSAEPVVEPYRGKRTLIHYIHQQRRGLSVSRNTALQHAHCPIVAVTDDDCVPDGNWIAALEQAFASSAAPIAVTGRVLPLGPEVRGLYMIAARESTARTDFRGKALPWVVGSGNNYAVRCDWYTRLGGCDERLGAGSPGQASEDMDLFYRLLRMGAHIRYEPEAVVYHERQNKSRRLATRWSYGFGIGAFCSIWLRKGDLYALYLLIRWIRTYTGELVSALLHGQWWQAWQRALSLRGTMQGLLYGFRAPAPSPQTAREKPADESAAFHEVVK